MPMPLTGRDNAHAACRSVTPIHHTLLEHIQKPCHANPPSFLLSHPQRSKGSFPHAHSLTPSHPPSHLQALARPPELKPLLCRMGLMQHVRPRLCPWCNDSDREALLVGKAIQHPPPAPAATAPLAAARSPRGLCSESESSSGSGRPCSNIKIKDRRRVSADGFAHPGTLLVICTSVHR